MLNMLAVFAIAIPGPSPQSPAAITDTTIATAPGVRLHADLAAGRIEVTTWERDAIRVHAKHDPGVAVRVDVSDAVVTVVVAVPSNRTFAEADLSLTVPRTMALTLGSGDVAIAVTGSGGDVIARNYSGAITIRDARGTVTATSMLGEVWITKVDGTVTASSTNAAVHIVDTRGDVNVEGTANHLYLVNVDSRHVSASTVSGGLWFTGPLRSDGRYAFTTHMGPVVISTPEPVNATIAFSTVRGAFSSGLKYDRLPGDRLGRLTARFGTGAAEVEVRTFGGAAMVKLPDASDRRSEPNTPPP